MPYRVQVTPDNRKAGCQDTQCKKDGSKILKGELRLGTWVEIHSGGFDSESWRWKHWGCVSGDQIKNMREYLMANSKDDDYNWEFFDGLDECPPDVQKKVKTAIIEGKIADEDFRGDPEYNKLGQKGIRGRATKPKADEENGDEAQPETPKKVPAKRGRVKKDDADDDGESKPAKKRPKKVEKDDDSEEDKVKPAKKPRTNKVKKEETVKVQSIKDEPTDDVDVDIKPAKKPRSKKAVKKEEDRDIKDEKPAANGIVEEEFKEEIKSGKSDRSQKVVKKEEAGSEADVKAVPVKKTRKNKVKKEEPVSEDEKVEEAKLPEEEIAVDEEDEEEKPKAKKGKKSKKFGTTGSRRSSRNIPA